MNLLGIDTSTEFISFAIMINSEVIFEFNRRKKYGASEVIVHLKNAIERLSISLKDFNAFCIGKGPGSFTGLRISFSIIKAFSLSLNKPVVSIGSFFSCVNQLKSKHKKVAMFSDARRNLIYGAPFIIKNGKIMRERKENLYSLEEFIRRYSSYTFVTYDAFLREKALSIKKDLNFYPKDIWPRARFLLMLSREYVLNKKFTSLDKLEPLYIYPKDCQVRKIYRG